MKLDDLKKLTAHWSFPPTSEHSGQLQAVMVELGLDPSNLYQELEMSSRFADAHRDSSYSNSLLQFHSHSFYELIFCRNTCDAEYLVGQERYRLQKGDIIFVPPGVSHRPLLPPRMHQPYIRDVIWFSSDLVSGISRLFPEPALSRSNYGSLLRTAGTKWEYIGDMIRNCVMESEQRAPGWEIALLGNTMSVMIHIKRAFEDSETVPLMAETPDLLEKAIRYIEENLAYKITLEETARQLFVSESTVSQTFRKKMGTSFYRCVTQRRLISAKRLIQDGYLLEEVGQKVGFRDYSSFYRAFRQEYGISPRQYRKLQESNL